MRTLFVLSLIAVSALLWSLARDDERAHREAGPAGRPEVLLLGVRAVQYGPDGAPSYRLRAEELTVLDAQRAKARDVEITVLDDGEPAARLRSPRLEMPSRQRAEFPEAVEGETLGDGEMRVRFFGRQMDVDLVAQTVVSRAPVIVMGPGWRSSAQGLFGELLERRLVLSGGVVSTYGLDRSQRMESWSDG